MSKARPIEYKGTIGSMWPVYAEMPNGELKLIASSPLGLWVWRRKRYHLLIERSHVYLARAQYQKWSDALDAWKLGPTLKIYDGVMQEFVMQYC